jgi:hypothetical protein
VAAAADRRTVPPARPYFTALSIRLVSTWAGWWHRQRLRQPPQLQRQPGAEPAPSRSSDPAATLRTGQHPPARRAADASDSTRDRLNKSSISASFVPPARP